MLILELVARSRHGLSLPEIVELTGLPKSSAHCLVLTFERRGYLHRNQKTHRYLCALKLFRLANDALTGLTIREQAMPYLQRLSLETGLTAHMAIMEKYEAVVIAKGESPGVSRLATWIGKRMDIHCTSLGKALLAQLPESEWERLAKTRGLPKRNENTITSFCRLRGDLLKVRKLGYAIDDEEDELGLRCIGVPVLDPAQNCIAAISLSGTTVQVTADTIAVFVAQMNQAVELIGGALRTSSKRALRDGSE